MRIRVLFAADYSAPKSGNFISSLFELSNELRANGGTAVFLLKEANPAKCPWITWLREHDYVVLGLDPAVPVLGQFEKIVEQYQIDIIHVHFGLYAGLLAKNARRFPHARIIIHDRMAYTDLNKITKAKLRQLLYSAFYRMKGVYTISVNEEKNRYYALCRHWFVPNGLSIQRNVSTDDSTKVLAPNYWNEPRPNGEKRCLFLGWQPQWKGLDIAIRAVELVRKRGIDLKLCVIGFGNGISKENRDFLETRTGISVDSDFIKLLNSEENMLAVHRSMDVYLSASRTEAFSNGLLEAISQEIPVVVSDIAGTKWSSAYTRSFFYPVESPEKCADALVKALNSTDLPSNAAEITNIYSIENWNRKMMDIYGKSIKK